MAAGKWNPGPVIDRGSVWRTTVRFEDSTGAPIPITAPGWMDIRTRPERTASRIARLDATGSADGRLTFGPDTNLVVLSMSGAETSQMDPGEYYFDLFVTNANNEPERLLFGTVTVRGEVSVP